MAGKSKTQNKSAEEKTSSPEASQTRPQTSTGASESHEQGQKSLKEILAEAAPGQLEMLTRNLSEAVMESQEILREVTTRQIKSGLENSLGTNPDPFGTNRAMTRVGESLAKHPERLFSAQMKLWEGHLDIWRSFLQGEESTATKDKRFSDPEWSENPFFDLIRKTYQLNSQWLIDLVDSSSELDDTTKRKAGFLARQTADAFAPTNFFSTNPAALRAMLETGGKSVLEGLKLAHEDIRRGHGRLMISQTDGTAFEVGKNIATSTGKVVFRNELIELIQYDARTEKVFETPLLIFPPWINKFYILDLREENSMIRWLTEQGYTVFLVSWRSADHSMSEFTWDDYIRLGAYAATEQVCTLTGEDQINTVGYCIGGTMLTGTLAKMAQDNDTRIRSATFFASQSDFKEAGDLLVFTDDESLDHISNLIDQNDGIMAGEDMGETFNYLRPSDLVWRYVVDNYMLGKKPRPFDLLYWNADQTNIPGPTHMTYLRELYAHNALSEGNFRVFGEPVQMGDIEIPVMMQAGREDHISPFRSVYRAARKFGGNVEFVLAGSGHIAGVVNPPSARKYQHWVNAKLPETVEEWLTDAEEHEGSWWPHWHKWLKKKSGKKIPARIVPELGLGDAPGTYVKAKLEDLGVGPLAK